MEETELTGNAQPDDTHPHDHPNVPRRGPVYTAFALVVASGILGAMIGSGLARASCDEAPSFLERLLARVDGFTSAPRSCSGTRIVSTLGGAVIATVGAGVVAVLVLRAMAEWRRHPPAATVPTVSGDEGSRATPDHESP